MNRKQMGPQAQRRVMMRNQTSRAWRVSTLKSKKVKSKSHFAKKWNWQKSLDKQEKSDTLLSLFHSLSHTNGHALHHRFAVSLRTGGFVSLLILLHLRLPAQSDGGQSRRHRLTVTLGRPVRSETFNMPRCLFGLAKNSRRSIIRSKKANKR